MVLNLHIIEHFAQKSNIKILFTQTLLNFLQSLRFLITLKVLALPIKKLSKHIKICFPAERLLLESKR